MNVDWIESFKLISAVNDVAVVKGAVDCALFVSSVVDVDCIDNVPSSFEQRPSGNASACEKQKRTRKGKVAIYIVTDGND